MTSNQRDLLKQSAQDLMSDNLKQAVCSLREGRPIVLLDAEDRENEGDLMVAAEKITPGSMNFLIQQGSGIVCLALSKARILELGLTLMSPDNTNLFQTAFCVSIESAKGVTTGVSARDRSQTVLSAMAPETKPHDLVRPGHIFPLAARSGGVFERMGHTEGSVDLMKIAGLKPGAVLCDLMNEDGSMMSGEDRKHFATNHNLALVSVEEVLFHRIKTEDIFEHRSFLAADSLFGPLRCHHFTFMGHAHVDLFMRDQGQELSGPKRLSIVLEEHLHKRYLSNMVRGVDDDPLAHALKSLLEQGTDVVALMSEPGLKQKAYLCRALREISATTLRGSYEEEFYNLALKYFGITYV